MAFSNDPPVYSISSSSPVPTADPNHSSTGTPRQRVPEEIPLEPAKQAPHSPPHGQSAGYSPFKAMTFRDEVLDRVCRKFHSALSSTEARITEELSRARATNLQLSDNFNALQITMSNYMIRGDDLERRAIAVEKRRESMAAAVQALEKHQTDVERYAEGTRVAYEQLLNNVAEDLGIDDSIYQLGRAYEKQRVDTQTYLRMVRTLSRDQYFCREKIRRLLGVLASAAAATDPI